MKKRFLLFACLLGLGTILNAQTYLFEDFSAGVMPPAGWTIDAHATDWGINNGSVAGGTAPEGIFEYNSWIGTSRLISPALNTTGATSIQINFNQMLDHYGAGYSVGVATRAGGGTWHTVWQVSPSASFGPELRIIVVNNSDVGASDFQFCLFLDGNAYQINYWYFDNITCGVALQTDLAMNAISTPSYGLGNMNVTGTFYNMGSDAVTSADVHYMIDGGTVYTTNLTGLSLAQGDPYDFTCSDALALDPGIYSMQVWVDNVNGGGPDQNAGNDSLAKTIHIASTSVARRPFFEEFTSSTCAPCANFNSTVFNPFVQQHGDEITLVKYQMYWPAPGDPYYTEEGGDRMDYYGVSYVPDLYVEGKQTPTTSSGVNGAFNTALDDPAFINIYPYHYFEGNQITIMLDMMPYFTGDQKVYAAVVEKVTTGNIMTNGETEFHNVMMKMVPDAFGTLVSFVDGEMAQLEVTASLEGTNIEEMSDLMVAVWIQDTSTKMVFQSAYSDSIGVGIAPGQTASSLKVYPNPTRGNVYLSGSVDVSKVEVYNNLGILVKTVEAPGITSVDLGALPSGIYLMKVNEQTVRVNLVR